MAMIDTAESLEDKSTGGEQRSRLFLTAARNISSLGERCSVYDQSLMMKEQWKISDGKTALNMEDCLQQDITGINGKHNWCKRWTRFFKLILYLELVLFFGWSFYMIIQSYRFNKTASELADITRERYSPLFESQPEVQPNTEIPVVFVKPEIILGKLKRLLEDMESSKKQDLMRDEAISAAADNNIRDLVYPSTPGPIIVQNENVMQVDDIDTLSKILSTYMGITRDEVSVDALPRWKTDLETPEYINEPRDTDPTEELLRYSLFLKKLGMNDVEKFENRNDFAEDTNPSIPNLQEVPALVESGEFERSEFDVAAISDLPNSMNPEISVSLTNNGQDMKQELLDFIGNAEGDRNSDDITINEESDKQTNMDIKADLILGYLPCESCESSDMLESVQDFIISQSVVAPGTTEEIENEENDNLVAGNKDRHDVGDSDVSMSTSPDVSAFKSDVLRFSFDKPMDIAQKTEDQLSPEIIPSNIKEDEKYEPEDDISNLLEQYYVLRSTTQNAGEYSVPNTEELEWFVPPARFADDLPEGPKDTPELNEDLLPPHTDVSTSEASFNEEVDLSSPERTREENLDVLRDFDYANSFDDYHTTTRNDDYALEQLDELIPDGSSETKAIETSQQASPQIIDAAELQESITNTEALNDASLYLPKITDSFDGTQDRQDAMYAGNDDKMEQTVSPFTTENNFEFKSVPDTADSEKEWISPSEIADTQIGDQRRSRQVQTITNEGQDFMNTGDGESSVKTDGDISDLKKELASTFLEELADNIKIYKRNPLEPWNTYVNTICGAYRRSPLLYRWCLKYIDKYRPNEDYDARPDNSSHDSDGSMIYRKKRMVNDLNVRQDVQARNSLEGGDTSNIALNIFKRENNEKAMNKQNKSIRRMGVSSARSNKLHERYFRLDKSNADYALDKFPAVAEKYASVQ